MENRGLAPPVTTTSDTQTDSIGACRQSLTHKVSMQIPWSSETSLVLPSRTYTCLRRSLPCLPLRDPFGSRRDYRRDFASTICALRPQGLQTCCRIILRVSDMSLGQCQILVLKNAQLYFGGSSCRGRCLFQDRLDHFVAHSYGFRKSWSKVLLDLLETIAVGLKGTERHAIRPCL